MAASTDNSSDPEELLRTNTAEIIGLRGDEKKLKQHKREIIFEISKKLLQFMKPKSTSQNVTMMK